MTKKVLALAVGIALAIVWYPAGCSVGATGGGGGGGQQVDDGDGGGGGGVPGGFEVGFDLLKDDGTGLGAFEAQAGVPTDNRGTGTLTTSGPALTSGSIRFDPADITVTPTGIGKVIPAMQGTSQLIITGWIDALEAVDTVCGGGEEYGPYTVTLDENNVPIAISPSSITLTQNTIDLLNLGEFSICLRLESPIDATVRIERLVFDIS
jgi:hypothetical protein